MKRMFNYIRQWMALRKREETIKRKLQARQFK